MLFYLVLCAFLASTCLGQTTSQTIEDEYTTMCKKEYPDFTTMKGVNTNVSFTPSDNEGSCKAICSGTKPIQGYYFNYTMKMIAAAALPDGRSCGEDQTCLGGHCCKMSDIQMCKDNQMGALTGMDFYGDCIIACKGDNNRVMGTMIARPAGVACSKPGYFRYPQKGFCDGMGGCNTTKTNYDY